MTWDDIWMGIVATFPMWGLMLTIAIGLWLIYSKDSTYYDK